MIQIKKQQQTFLPFSTSWMVPNIQYSNFHWISRWSGFEGNKNTTIDRHNSFRNTMVKQHGQLISCPRFRFTGFTDPLFEDDSLRRSTDVQTRQSLPRCLRVYHTTEPAPATRRDYTLDNTGYDAGLLVRRRSQRWSAIRGRLN